VRVAIFHNEVTEDASAAERDVLAQIQAVSEALRSLDHEVICVPCTLNLELARERLLDVRPDVVFNLVESFGGSDWLAFLATAVLDLLHIPYTGSPTSAIMLSADKLLAKERLERSDLATPPWLTMNGETHSGPGRPIRHRIRPNVPCIVKSVTQHASFGLEEESVLPGGTLEELHSALGSWAVRMGGACFLEEYVDGREFNVAVLGGVPRQAGEKTATDSDASCAETQGLRHCGAPVPTFRGEASGEVLPPAEIVFSAFPAGKPRIVGYRAKWQEESFEYAHTIRQFDFPPGDRPLLERLHAIALSCWELFGLRGYARVDFRVDPAGHPWLLEVNANPCLSPDAGFAAALARASIPYREAIRRILEDTG